MNNGRPPIVCLVNGKGGQGKSTLALALAAYTARTHGSALLVDCDPQGSAYEATEVMTDPGYKALHETDPAQLGALSDARGFDLVIVDTPGNLETAGILAAVLNESDFALIPYDHDPLSLRPTLRTCQVAALHGTPHAVVVNNVDPRLGAAHLLDAWATLEQAGVPHFRTAIRRYRAWSNSLAAGQPITRFTGSHARDARDDLAGVMTELLRSMPRRGAA
jgi:chromosome partitioning protein